MNKILIELETMFAEDVLNLLSILVVSGVKTILCVLLDLNILKKTNVRIVLINSITIIIPFLLQYSSIKKIGFLRNLIVLIV